MKFNCNNKYRYKFVLLVTVSAIVLNVLSNHWLTRRDVTTIAELTSETVESSAYISSLPITQDVTTRTTITTGIPEKSAYISKPFISQRGNYWVLYDYIKRKKRFGYNNSVTYATHGEFTYLDNVVQLAGNWKGPLSVSVYCPGTDYNRTLNIIKYLRNCFPKVKDLVTFHILFDHEEVPNNFWKNPWKEGKKSQINCELPMSSMENVTTYRKEKNLEYPINTARNIAREMSPTYYVLMADIELYTSPPNLIPDFLEMIRRNKNFQNSTDQVFVLPVFEVEKSIEVLPRSKTELQSLLNKKLAVHFHAYTCSRCHKIPEYKKWVNAPMSTGLQVFHTAKRSKSYHLWEPFYIGTNQDPLFDERFPREGEFNKMLQVMTMCLLDYDFHILDNAFLVHRPGMKRKKVYTAEMLQLKERNRRLAKKVLSTEMKFIYGSRDECGHW